MARISTQAQDLIKALRDIGIERRDFRVHTRFHYEPNGYGGRYKVYDEAAAVLYSSEAHKLAAKRAQELADQHLYVLILDMGKGEPHVIVDTSYNHHCRVNHR